MKGGSSNVDVSSLIDHTEIKAKLAKALEERNALELKFKVSPNNDRIPNFATIMLTLFKLCSFK